MAKCVCGSVDFIKEKFDDELVAVNCSGCGITISFISAKDVNLEPKKTGGCTVERWS